MKFLVYRYKCGSCRNWFEGHDVGPCAYGEFLLRSEANGEEQFLNALTDPVYDEVDQILRFIPNVPSNDLARSDILQLVFGVACDPASDGTTLQIGREPRCPYCNSSNIDYWEATEPPRFDELDIRHVTHRAWNVETESEKEKLLTKALERIGRT